MLVDFGEVAEYYVDDVVATGNFLEMGVEEIKCSKERKVIVRASDELMAGRLNGALKLLGSSCLTF